MDMNDLESAALFLKAFEHYSDDECMTAAQVWDFILQGKLDEERSGFRWAPGRCRDREGARVLRATSHDFNIFNSLECSRLFRIEIPLS